MDDIRKHGGVVQQLVRCGARGRQGETSGFYVAPTSARWGRRREQRHEQSPEGPHRQ